MVTASRFPKDLQSFPLCEAKGEKHWRLYTQHIRMHQTSPTMYDQSTDDKKGRLSLRCFAKMQNVKKIKNEQIFVSEHIA